MPAALELTGAPLFNKRVGINPASTSTAHAHTRSADKPALYWGWHANTSRLLINIKLRYPHTSPVPGCFDSYREGRHVIFSGCPDSVRPRDQHIDQFVYAACHAYNVLGSSEMIRLKIGNAKCRKIDVYFATREQAEEVCRLYHDTLYDGFKLAVAIRRPPMKYLGVSWESGHNRAHYQLRDYGSAKYTNFESVCIQPYPQPSLIVHLKSTTGRQLLTGIRCKMMYIEGGFSLTAITAQTVDFGCPDISTRSQYACWDAGVESAKTPPSFLTSFNSKSR